MPPKPRKSTPPTRKPTTGQGPSRNLLIGLVVAAVVVAALVVGTIVLTGGDSNKPTTTAPAIRPCSRGSSSTARVLGNPAAT